MATRDTTSPPPAFRVFVSSTYSDMLPYREAIRTAINKADCVPYGMERFGATSIPPLETCYEELASSQIYVCALGMRYGSIDEATGKSYTQLEYEKAKELGKPILAFLVDEDEVAFKAKDIDKGDSGAKLEQFKDDIKNSKEVTCSFFDSPMSLQEAVYRSVLGEIKRQGTRTEGTSTEETDYLEGAKIFAKFVKRPEKYKNSECILRVRMDGRYGGWRLRDEVFLGFGFVPGDALFLNDIFVTGYPNIDVDENIWYVDCFASEEAADWLDNNSVTTGTLFEGKFKLVYELVEKGGGTRGTIGAVDTKIANIVLLKGIKVISHGIPVRSNRSGSGGMSLDDFMHSGMGRFLVSQDTEK